MASTEIEQYLKPADAGYNINPDGGVDQSADPVNPFYNRNQTEAPRTYDQVRGEDKINSVINNSLELQFTEDEQNNYLRLLMPMYTRRVEVEDLNRNFWVIGQAINFISEKIKWIDNGGTDPGVERLKFEKTIERDRDNHDYSNYSHKIIFNEGYNGLKTPYMVKDYCYRSNELSSKFEGEVIWYRQLGGINSADQAYIIGGGGNTPFLNFYKPRPDAIPIFNVIQTENSDTESFNAGDEYKKIKNSTADESIYMNLLGTIREALADGSTSAVTLDDNLFGSALTTFTPSSSLHGQIVISRTLELTPVCCFQGGEQINPQNPLVLSNNIINGEYGIRTASTKSQVAFNQFTEGQIIYYTAQVYSVDTSVLNPVYVGTASGIPGSPTVGQYWKMTGTGTITTGSGTETYYEGDYIVYGPIKKDSSNNIVNGWTLISSQYNGAYVKSYKTVATKNGYVIPASYCWKKVLSESDYGQLTPEQKNSKKYICPSLNAGILALNYTDQKFMLQDGVWRALDSTVLRDGPTVPEYRIVENGSAFRVLGDSSREITEGSSTKPIINYKEIATTSIHPHDVVRYIDPNGPTYGKCFEWWDGKWREIKNCDASYVNIFLWLPQKTNTLRGVYYWTLKWLIPPGLVEY